MVKEGFVNLFSRLKTTKKARELFVLGQIKTGIPFQVRAMRDAGKWTQEKLGKEAEMPQTVISRLENSRDAKFTLKTLLRIAAAFDVALVVRFVPFSELIKWVNDLSHQKLCPPTFAEEFLKTNTEEADETTAKGWVRVLEEIQQSLRTKTDRERAAIQFHEPNPFQQLTKPASERLSEPLSLRLPQPTSSQWQALRTSLSHAPPEEKQPATVSTPGGSRPGAIL